MWKEMFKKRERILKMGDGSRKKIRRVRWL